MLLPGLSNAYAYLDKKLKARYHALCVLSSNFSCLLWQKLTTDFSENLNLPAEFAKPILAQCTKNLLTKPQSALTGHLVRNDLSTIASNLAALEGDPFQVVYKSFINAYQAINQE